jgi:hypothetical protein
MSGLYKKELFKLLKIFNNKFIDILDAVILVHPDCTRTTASRMACVQNLK